MKTYKRKSVNPKSYSSDITNAESFLSWRKTIKNQIMSSNMAGERFVKEFAQLKYVLERTIKHCESDSVLLIGLQGAGKTMILNEALNSLKTSEDDAIVVHLNGLIHTDDSLALKEIICQLHLNELEGERASGSFSDNLLFLLQSLRTGDRETSKPVIFILDEFHLFCFHRNQTLLYNLFEAAQANWAPICVVGITTRIDVTELLEKRVKSRFSHRTIFLLPTPSTEERLQLFKSLLSLEEDAEVKIKGSFNEKWNDNINDLCNNHKVREVIQNLIFYDCNEESFRSFLLTLICKISISSDLQDVKLTADDIVKCYHSWSSDAKECLIQGLSTLELCLVIAMTHQMELYDDEPFNFEMILNRYLKFAKQSNSVKLTERPVIMKAFERIQALELMIPLNGVTGRSGLKEYQMYNFLLTKDQVKRAVQSYSGLQTDIIQWANSSLD